MPQCSGYTDMAAQFVDWLGIALWQPAEVVFPGPETLNSGR